MTIFKGGVFRISVPFFSQSVGFTGSRQLAQVKIPTLQQRKDGAPNFKINSQITRSGDGQSRIFANAESIYAFRFIIPAWRIDLRANLGVLAGSCSSARCFFLFLRWWRRGRFTLGTGGPWDSGRGLGRCGRNPAMRIRSMFIFILAFAGCRTCG